MEEKLEFIRETLIEKMYTVLKSDKITSTEQMLNFAKAYGELSEHKVMSADAADDKI
ncbi:MAG: hypothetical protein RR234_03675 [Christensenella sp.]